MKPITKTYKIQTKYGFNYNWKHNGQEYRVEEENGFIIYWVNYHREGCLIVNDILNMTIDEN